MEHTSNHPGIAAVALVADLLFSSKVRGAAASLGVEAVTVTKAEKLVEEARKRRPRVVLLDLTTRGVDFAALITRLKTDSEIGVVPVIAFGPHVATEALQQARAAGADRVMARSAFVRELPELLRG